MENQEPYNIEIQKRFNELIIYFFKVFGKTLISTIAFIGTISGLVIRFSSLTFNSYGWNGLSIMLLISIILSVIIALIYLFRKIRTLPPIVKIDVNSLQKNQDSLLSSELIETITKLHNKGKHIEVVRLASNISRPLWISGRYDERISIGAFYEDSSARIKDVKNRIASLIDDLGWTNAAIGKIDEAQKNISKGITIAKKNNEFYLAAKGQRHLGTIELRFKENPDAAIKLLQDSLQMSEAIGNNHDKMEMLAGIKYNLSECYLMKYETQNALKYAKEVEKIFEKLNDKVRILKVNSQVARVLLKEGKTDEAKEIFSETLEDAKKLSRPDEIGKCLIGLGEIYILEDKKDLASNILSEAVEVFTEIKSFKELNKANELILKINLKKNRYE
jgi:tetratricopeptide (TPR) repeat protein